MSVDVLCAIYQRHPMPCAHVSGLASLDRCPSCLVSIPHRMHPKHLIMICRLIASQTLTSLLRTAALR